MRYLIILVILCFTTSVFATEHLDNKLPEKWNTLSNKELIIWLYHRISQRLDRVEQELNLQPLIIDKNEPDMGKIEKPKAGVIPID
ncbi:unnamed protein product [marine sediment metagenome]|uniref:Uncharacterized protein n=1 Tax=marine sediment metagenome TaxID=412755 RepID=X0WLZ9_9ZZZZ